MNQNTENNLELIQDAEGVSLVNGDMVLRGDFVKLMPRIKPFNLKNELVVRAAKIKGSSAGLTVIDATAGLGEDAFLLAAAGFFVKLYEYDPVIAKLLKDALRRASLVPELKEIAERMELFEEDSIAALKALKESPDVVLLDPMFPKRQKSALIKKKFQLLQQLERPCADEEALLQAAIAAEPRKIIIKRPVKGPCLANHKPDYSLNSKVIRFDCLMLIK